MSANGDHITSLEELDGASVGATGSGIAPLHVYAESTDAAPIRRLRVDRGRIAVDDGLSADPEADALALCGDDDASVNDLLFGSGAAIDRASSLNIRAPGTPWRRHLPFDVDPTAQPGAPIPNVTVDIRHVCRRSILGDLEFIERFVDGRLVDRNADSDGEDAHVTVFSTFRRLVTAFDPRLDSLTAVTGMRIECTSPAFVLVAAGIYEDRSFRGFLDQYGSLHRRLADWADVLFELRAST